MRVGWALPLAGAVLLGAVLGWWMPSGLFEAWALAVLLVAARWRAMAVLLGVMAVPAVSILLAQGAVLPQGLSREDLRLEGRVLQVDSDAGMTRMHVAVEHCVPLAAQRLPCSGLRQVRLSAYDAPLIQAGERWVFHVRLRPPSGFANPHAFDYRTWLWRQGIGATGYVRESPPSERLGVARASVKDWALEHLDARLEDGPGRRWLATLTLGAGDRFSDDDWELLNASGTTHLVIISGLHVGLVSAFVLLASRGLARLVTPGSWRLAIWPWGGAALATVGYAALAGFEPPAQRAMIMTLVGLWVASGRHAPGAWQAWWLALALVVLLDPLSLWRPGLWLSFGAVALLILVWRGRARPRGIKGWWWSLLRTQALLEPMMAAGVLLAFDRLALVSPLTNLVAVPLVGTLMVPLGLMGWVFAWLPPLSWLCWWMFGQLASGMQRLLELSVVWVPPWDPEPWQGLPVALALGLLSLLWALPGIAVSLRVSGSVVLSMLPLTLAPPTLPHGTLQVRVHDVGQGQLVDIRTANHRLLYDTGPRFRSGFMPLESLWRTRQRFDSVIVSHGDLDHAGGVPALSEHLLGDVLAPQGEDIGMPFDACQAGQHWRWDGVTFRILWPPAGDTSGWSSNDRSCVLLIESVDQRVLITGDVGREAERRFLLEVPVPVTLLVAGHHGSRTSSGPQLVSMLQPDHVIFSAGPDNAFGHPHDEVVRRFRRAFSCLWSTAHDGAVTWHLDGVEAPRFETQRGAGWSRARTAHECRMHAPP